MLSDGAVRSPLLLPQCGLTIKVFSCPVRVLPWDLITDFIDIILHIDCRRRVFILQLFSALNSNL